MGIKGLSKLLGENADGCMRQQEMKSYFGRKIAIDASMCLYQFLIAIRQDGPGGMLTDEDGEPTSHLNGIFYRTIRMAESGIKCCYVFDGAAPTMKGGELEKRKKLKQKAEEELKKAQAEDDQEAMAKFEKRTTRVTRKQNEEAKKLLRLMGIPVVESPGEAEAQCAELAKGGKVYATATEDMDALTFGTPRLVRHMLSSQARQKVQPIHEFNLSDALSGLDMDMTKFIDLCILCGCDYTNSIRGIGPKKAVTFIQKHNNIEGIIEAIKGEKRYVVPEGFNYKGARDLFVKPLVTPASDVELKWMDPDVEGVIRYMCEEKGFNQQRIESGIARLKKSKKSGNQKRLESFFGAVKVKKRKTPGGKKTKGRSTKKSKTRK